MRFRVCELTPAFGAEIEGLDLRRDVNAEAIRALRKVFDDRGVLVFRGLDLEADDHARLAWLLVEGEPVIYRHHMSIASPRSTRPTGACCSTPT